MFELVYALLIPEGNTEQVREYFVDKKEKEQNEAYLKQLADYRKDMGWERSDFWLQHVGDKNFFIVQVKGEGEPNSDYQGTLLRRYNEGCPIAKRVRERQLNLFHTDPCDPKNTPDLDLLFHNEAPTKEATSTYAFAYPLVSGGSEKIRAFYAEMQKDEEKTKRYRESFTSKGIVEVYIWIQKGEKGEFAVFSQRITDLAKSRASYIQGLEKDAMAQEVSNVFAEATSLKPTELIPDLEPLMAPEKAQETRWKSGS